MIKIVGIQFKQRGKVYYFDHGNFEFKKGDGVIVETARGTEYGTVCIPQKNITDDELTQPLKPILRLATDKDKEIVARNEERRPQAMQIAKEKVAKHGLEMKVIDCEFTFDGGKIIFYFTSEGRVDFRELVKDLASVFHMRIELRQVGIRDETRMLGGLAPCGRECCCAGAMPEFCKASIKMAKNQGLSINLGKISGLCGRLMCCLSYENAYYSEAIKKMPKIGGEVLTPDGKATVVSNNMLLMKVRVRMDGNDGSIVYKDFPVDELEFNRSRKEESAEDGDDGNEGGEE